MSVRQVIPVSGKDSFWTAHIQKQLQPRLDYEYLYNPTGMELPEVKTWLELVQDYLGKPIHRVGDDLVEIIREEGMLPGHKTRFCTRKAKIFPMEDWIGTDEALVYYGIRADEKRVGYQSLSSKLKITPVYPLKDAGITLPMVWQGVTELDMLPPQFFWQEMYEMVIRRLGERVASELLAGYQPWERNMLFAWRTRPNCHACFYQRLYEWVGLLEHHPVLFWQNDALEVEVGAADRREKAFTFKQGWSLKKIAEKKETIKRKRCIAICRSIAKRAQMPMLFDDETELDEELDMLEVVSCGLFCGK